ncbi:MAG: hypothetical protein SV375_06380, partial [Thermodesulfobacteriota bacterium]|nr:hypothetical protein [Thermodesulfobacteriota bacterium]
GNRKATNEYINLLNVYYHRWQGSAPIVSRIEPSPKAEAMPEHLKETVKHELPPKTASTMAGLSEIIDNFEQSYGQWAAFIDQVKNTKLSFECDQAHAHNGRAALRITYEIAPESWALCSLVYQHPRNWKSFKGLTVYLHALRVGQPAIIIAYQGKSSDNLSHFEFRMKTGKDAVTGWQRVDIPWDRFTQAAWEGDGTAKFDPSSSMGLAFSFEADESGGHTGKLWVDDVTLLSAKGSAKGK